MRKKGGNATADQQNLQRLMADCFVVSLPALALFSYILTSFRALGDGDTGWHVAAGQWMITHRAVPRVDIFSYTAHGRPWVAHEWLADLLMGGAYNASGWTGVLLLYAVCAAALVTVIALYLRRWLEPIPAALVLSLVLAGLFPFLLARPHVAAWPLLALWTVTLLRAREEGRVPSAWHALWLVVWANLHGSFVFGLALAGLFAAEAVCTAPVSRRWHDARRWALFGIACLAATLVTPHGLTGLLFPFQLASMPVLGAIAEWRPSDFASIGVFEVVLIAGIGSCLWLGVRLGAWRVLLLALLLHMALAHNRHQAVLLIVGTLVLAEGFAGARGRSEPRFDLGAAMRGQCSELIPLAGILVFLALGVTGWKLALPIERPDTINVPGAALHQLPSALRTARVFNDYNFGGSLSLAGVPVSIDGRADMYGEAAMREYLDLSDHPDASKLLAAQRRWGFEWTILPPGSPLVQLLDMQTGWHRTYADKWAVIHVDDTLFYRLHPLPH